MCFSRYVCVDNFFEFRKLKKVENRCCIEKEKDSEWNDEGDQLKIVIGKSSALIDSLFVLPITHRYDIIIQQRQQQQQH